MSEEHIDINVGKGILAPINKPNKTKGQKELLRAVTLLPIIRKVLSNIVLERANDKTEKYLSQSQSGYREFRSTSHIVWAYRWLTSRTEIYKEKIYITGIDMSSGFDRQRKFLPRHNQNSKFAKVFTHKITENSQHAKVFPLQYACDMNL